MAYQQAHRQRCQRAQHQTRKRNFAFHGVLPLTDPARVHSPRRIPNNYWLAFFALAEPLSPALSSGLGVLSPIPFTLESNSGIDIPERASNSAGTCAAICAMSPVILLTPAEVPLPVDTTVILSTLASGCAIARTTSGMLVISLSTTAAWFHSW